MLRYAKPYIGLIALAMAFALLFAGACYAKYKQLKALHVGSIPLEPNERQ